MRHLQIVVVPPDVELATGVAPDPHRVWDAGRLDQRIDLPGNVGVVNDRHRIGVAQDVAQLPLGIGRIDRDRLGTGGMHGKHRDRQVERISADQRDARSARPVADEFIRKAGHAVSIFAIRQLTLAAAERGLLWKTRASVCQHVDDSRKHAWQRFIRRQVHCVALCWIGGEPFGMPGPRATLRLDFGGLPVGLGAE